MRMFTAPVVEDSEPVEEPVDIEPVSEPGADEESE